MRTDLGPSSTKACASTKVRARPRRAHRPRSELDQGVRTDPGPSSTKACAPTPGVRRGATPACAGLLTSWRACTMWHPPPPPPPPWRRYEVAPHSKRWRACTAGDTRWRHARRVGPRAPLRRVHPLDMDAVPLDKELMRHLGQLRVNPGGGGEPAQRHAGQGRVAAHHVHRHCKPHVVSSVGGCGHWRAEHDIRRLRVCARAQFAHRGCGSGVHTRLQLLASSERKRFADEVNPTRCATATNRSNTSACASGWQHGPTPQLEPGQRTRPRAGARRRSAQASRTARQLMDPGHWRPTRRRPRGGVHGATRGARVHGGARGYMRGPRAWGYTGLHAGSARMGGGHGPSIWGSNSPPPLQTLARFTLMLRFDLTSSDRAPLARCQLVHHGAMCHLPDESSPVARAVYVASAEDPTAPRLGAELLNACSAAPYATCGAHCKAVDLHSAAHRQILVQQLAAAFRTPESAQRRLLLWLLLWPGYDAGRPEASQAVAAAAAADTLLDMARSRPASGSVTPRDAQRARQKRSVRCGRCTGCRASRCGTCQECLDNPRFGGLGKRKKSCLARMCEWTTRPVWCAPRPSGAQWVEARDRPWIGRWAGRAAHPWPAPLGTARGLRAPTASGWRGVQVADCACYVYGAVSGSTVGTRRELTRAHPCARHRPARAECLTMPVQCQHSGGATPYTPPPLVFGRPEGNALSVVRGPCTPAMAAVVPPPTPGGAMGFSRSRGLGIRTALVAVAVAPGGQRFPHYHTRGFQGMAPAARPFTCGSAA